MMNTCAHCVHLKKNKFLTVVSEVTKMVKTRASQYCRRMKQTMVKKNENGLSSSYRAEICPSPSYVQESTSSDSPTDDSGIMLNPSLPQNKVVVTRAIIETRRGGPCSSSTPKKASLTGDLISASKQEEDPSYITVIGPKEYGEPQEVVTAVGAEAGRHFSKYDEILEFADASSDEEEKPPAQGSASLSRWRNVDLSNVVGSVEEKFVVNLFQSRQSNKWKRTRLHVDSFERKVHIIEEKEIEGGTGGDKKEQESDAEADAMFYKLKKMRDAECVRMKEASNAMRAIRNKKVMEWAEVLLTEKILLETDQKYQVIMNKIRDLKYSDWRFKEPKHSAKVKLSNFQYQLNWDQMTDEKNTEFFVLVLSHETDVIASKITRALGEKLVFNETFTMNNLDDGFSIKAEVFSIKMNDSKSRMITALLKKKTKTLCPIFRIYYENINTNEVQESAVLKSSFTSCGTVIITKDHIDQNTGVVTQPSGDAPRLDNKATFAIEAHLTVASKLSGFLTLGKADEHNNVVFWERKWCSLDGTLFTVYNYPQEQEYAKPPATSIDLEFCLEPLARPANFPKKFTFVLKTGRPSKANDSNNVVLRRKNNFVLEKYYFYADNRDDFGMWTGELDSILASLKEWKRLIFADELY